MIVAQESIPIVIIEIKHSLPESIIIAIAVARGLLTVAEGCTDEIKGHFTS